jgi:peptidoglycan/xylan/chitin deacetylase (PgdA/CDA1 family)
MQPPPPAYDGSTTPSPSMPAAASRFARARSRLLREAVAAVLPRSLVLVHGPRDVAHKRVALTFDDGPDSMTLRYLDALARLDVRATFFVIGENAARAPDTVAEYERHGHEVGSHGWSHDPFPTMTPARLAGELARTEAVLPARRSGRRMVRPPRGALSLGSVVRIATSGAVAALWSVDSDDCRTRDPARVERALRPDRVSPGDVVLLHEMQPWTLEALPGAVSALRAAGLEMVTMSELMTDEASK